MQERQPVDEANWSIRRVANKAAGKDMANMTVMLKSYDDELFEVNELVACELQTVKLMIEDAGTDSTIPLPNVSSKILSKVLEYCTYHVQSQQSSVPEDEVKQWDAQFMKIDQATLYDLMLTAYYLNAKNLLDFALTDAAHRLKNQSPESIRTLFNIKNDFTPEEEQQVWRENRRAYQ